GNGISFLVGDGHDGVVEGRLDMHDASMDDALFLLLEAFFLGGFSWCFRHTIMSSPRLSSCWPRYRDVDPCACARWCACAGRAPADRGGAAIPGRSPSRCDA